MVDIRNPNLFAKNNAIGVDRTAVTCYSIDIRKEPNMTLERLMNCVLHKEVPAKPEPISIPRWNAMVRQANYAYGKELKVLSEDIKDYA